MKKLFGLFLIVVSFYSCNTTQERTDYVINGTAKGMYNGVRVYLNETDDRGRQVAVDTAMVMNESFVFNGAVDYPKIYYFTANGIPGRFELMIENTEMTINVDSETLNNSTVTGSKSHDLYKSFSDEFLGLKDQLIKAQNAYRESNFKKDSLAMETNRNAVATINEKMVNYPYDFIEEYKDEYAVLPVIRSQLFSRQLNIEKMVTTFDNLDTIIKNTKEGQQYAKAIDQLRARIEAEKATAIGAKAPEFKAPNPDDELIALSEVVNKGKITIIDFWAAWCGPCRRENPNIVKVYNKYHDKGLEIIGVGLDGRRGQKDPKGAWKKAIEDDKLTWHQVSNLNYFGEIAKAYSVNSIPSMFVLNDKGEIIAKNLRGIALERKISELLD